ncbi:ABC transporter ATP-binding protein [Patescibacteria group bacterium]|nr:ABC transporter ATP-binding protein [Patescibacteria group bacterium]
MKDFKRLFVETKPLHPVLLVILLLAIIGSLLEMATPWLYREIVNFLTSQNLSELFARYLGDKSKTEILFWLIGIYFAIDLINSGLIGQVRFYLDAITGVRSNLLLTKKSLGRILSMSVGFFEKKAPGMLSARMNSGISEIFGIVRSLVVSITPLVINFTIAVVVMFMFSKPLSLVFAIVAPIYVVISIWRARIMRFWQKKLRTQWERQHRLIIDNFYHQQLIKEFSREDYELSRLEATQAKILSMRKTQERLLRLTGFLREFVYVLGYMWVYGYGGYLVLTGKLMIGDLILFVAYLGRVLGPLGSVMQIYDSIQVGMVSIQRLFKIWDYKDEVTDVLGAEPIKVSEGGIEFKQVGFSYKNTKKFKGEKVVFKNLNLRIEPREVVALVGPSGVGKSTFVKLLMRFYDPVKGQVLIDGQDIKHVTQRSLRKHISAVMQDVAVFNNTIGYNIKYGKPAATDQQVTEVAKIANLFDFIVSLRKRFKTMVGEKGVRLSGGERQRLAIARAILKDAKIIVMDEATSALDSENEKKIQDAMWKLIEGRTTIIVAHRLSTVKRADRIVVFDKGKILEQGTHEELMKKSGYYRRLFTMQGQALL